MNPFPTRQAAEAYLSKITDPGLRDATRARLGLEAELPKTSPPTAPLPAQQKLTCVPIPAAAPKTSPPLRPAAAPRGGAPLGAEVHTYLGTLDGGALLFALPWGPSINHYWRHILKPCKPKNPGAPPYYVKLLMSEEGRMYRLNVRTSLDTYRAHAPFVTPPGARLAVHLTLCAPTRRSYDVDNHVKACLDALTHCGVWADDSLIDELRVTRGPVTSGGQVHVTITPLTTTLFEVQS